MRGFVRRRSSGSCQIGWKVKDPITGTWKQRTQTVRGTKREAEEEPSQILASLRQAAAPGPSGITVREFLEKLLRDCVGAVIQKPKTRTYYTTIVRSHLIPALGAIPLAKLTAERVQRYYSEKVSHGRLDRTGTPLMRSLSRTTVHGHHQTLHTALAWGVELGLVARNVWTQSSRRGRPGQRRASGPRSNAPVS